MAGVIQPRTKMAVADGSHSFVTEPVRMSCCVTVLFEISIELAKEKTEACPQPYTRCTTGSKFVGLAGIHLTNDSVRCR